MSKSYQQKNVNNLMHFFYQKICRLKNNSYLCIVKQLKQNNMNAQNTITKKLNQVATIVACKTIKGTSFVGVRNYTNSKGEVSNQTFLVGINYANLLQADLETLKAFDIQPLIAKYDKEVVAKAYNELLTSLIKRTATELEKEVLRANGDSTIARSDAQNEAYLHIAKGLKAQDENLYIYGLCVKKTVIEAIEYPKVNSQLKTIVKNEITKLANLKEGKYKQFKLGKLEELNIQGVTI